MPDKELALSETEIKQSLTEVPTWTLANGRIEKNFKFTDFIESMRFVNRVAELAETQEHHPEINIDYNQVKLTLSTHDVNGLSQKDFTLALKVDQLV